MHRSTGRNSRGGYNNRKAFPFAKHMQRTSMPALKESFFFLWKTLLKHPFLTPQLYCGLTSEPFPRKKKCSLSLRQAEWYLDLTSEVVTHKFQKELTTYYTFILTCSQTGLFSLRTCCPSQSSINVANKFIYHNS